MSKIKLFKYQKMGTLGRKKEMHTLRFNADEFLYELEKWNKKFTTSAYELACGKRGVLTHDVIMGWDQ